MRSTERNLVLGVTGVVLIAAFYFMVLSPKRDKAAKLSAQVTELQQSVDAQRQRAEEGEQAKQQFNGNYRKVVLLGKAAPDYSDTSSFLYQLNDLAERNHIKFAGLKLTAGDASTASAPAQPGIANAPAASSQPSATAATPEPGTTATDNTQPTSETTAAAAPATEAAASTIPIGAGVGPAGLSTLKYTLEFTGLYFDVSDFMASVDELVSSSDGKVSVNGRLSTVDGFSLTADQDAEFPHLSAELAVTTYTTPPGQGLTGGATPAGPAALPSQTPQLAAQQGAAP
jgi:Tfp pilus assembly protein PilO